MEPLWKGHSTLKGITTHRLRTADVECQTSFLTSLFLARPFPYPETGNCSPALLLLSHRPRAWVLGTVVQTPALQVSACTLRSSMAALDLPVPK